jgi:hypothetical protein
MGSALSPNGPIFTKEIIMADANNEIVFSIDTSALDVQYEFIGDTIDLPEGSITIDSAGDYSLTADVDDSFYTFSSTDDNIDVSVTGNITINADNTK